MRGSWLFVRTALALALGLLLAGPATAQLGRISGSVRDEAGGSIKGATVVAESDDAASASFTAITGDRGQFTMIGLRGGTWRFIASAPGFVASSGSGRIRTIGSNPSIEFRLARATTLGAGGRLAGIDPNEVQASLAQADAHLSDGRYDDAIAVFRELQARVPALTTLTLQIGRALRAKRDFDAAVVVYRDALALDSADGRTAAELGLTYLEKGDLALADTTLRAAAGANAPGKEVYFALGELTLARERPDEAARFYQQAADADPAWLEPVLKLGIIAASTGDREAATRHLERVVSLGPASGEATQARAILEQLRR